MGNALRAGECTPGERLTKVFGGEAPGRTPVLGGWIACPEHICGIAGVSAGEYWSDPVRHTVEAYRRLGTDGLIDICVPVNRGDFRVVDENTYLRSSKGESLEDAAARVERMPTAEEYEAAFDIEGEYAKFKAHLLKYRALCGEMLFMPAQWGAGAKFSWYDDLGYENFFLLVGLRPGLAQKLMELGGAMGYCKSRLVARAVGEGLYPGAVLLGEDICTQRGPMLSPDFLEKCYAPALRRGLSPLLEAGCRPVWHSDGDVRPLLGMLLDCGVQGFQGFQPECGVTLELISGKRTREGGKLLIFGPLAVTTELPVCTPGQIKEKVRRAVDVCRGNADLALFTSNTINPDVPLENIYAMYEAAKEYTP
jgi:hypothetical protein